jgi:hypothetical protein
MPRKRKAKIPPRFQSAKKRKAINYYRAKLRRARGTR